MFAFNTLNWQLCQTKGGAMSNPLNSITISDFNNAVENKNSNHAPILSVIDKNNNGLVDEGDEALVINSVDEYIAGKVLTFNDPKFSSLRNNIAARLHNINFSDEEKRQLIKAAGFTMGPYQYKVRCNCEQIGIYKNDTWIADITAKDKHFTRTEFETQLNAISQHFKTTPNSNKVEIVIESRAQELLDTYNYSINELGISHEKQLKFLFEQNDPREINAKIEVDKVSSNIIRITMTELDDGIDISYLNLETNELTVVSQD